MKERRLAKKSTLDWTSLAVGSALVMLFYFTLTNHVDLYPLVVLTVSLRSREYRLVH